MGQDIRQRHGSRSQHVTVVWQPEPEAERMKLKCEVREYPECSRIHLVVFYLASFK